MFKMLIPGAVAAFLLLGASNAKACCIESFEAWIVLGVESSSEDFQLGTQVVKCMDGVKILHRRNFRFEGISQVRSNISLLYFERPNGNGNGNGGDAVSLFCYAIINQFDEDG